MKKIVIIGSTGSIGMQALDIIRHNRDKFKVTGLAVKSSVSLLRKQIEEFNPEFVSVEQGAESLDNTTVLSNSVELVKRADADIILLAAVGVDGLEAANEAVGKGVRIALANKETLVAAGGIIIKRAKKFNSEIIPVDSEHSAIFQCLLGKKPEKIILTASGGAFRNYTKDELVKAKARDALKHPVWNMGAKVTIDSATLMNKGLEVIEAMHLFNVGADAIEVVIHPESIIHSMVEFIDGAVIAEMSIPDMKVPISFAFTYPERINANVKRLNFTDIKSLTFMKPDTDKFPCLDIAYKCARTSGAATVIMNAANEACVQLYLEDRIGFYDIPALINAALDKFADSVADEIEDIIVIDSKVKEYILASSY